MRTACTGVFVALFLSPAIGGLFASSALATPDVLATFTLSERFGIAHPDQPVEFEYHGGPVNPALTRVIGPAGREVPFQQLSNGNILVRTRLPKSLKRLTYYQDRFEPDTDLLQLSIPTGEWPPAGATAVQIVSVNQPPGGLSPGINYFMKSGTGNWPYQFRLSSKRDLSDTIDITSYGSWDAMIAIQGWIVDPMDPSFDTLYAPQHSYETGDPLQVRSSGNLPQPLQKGTTYYAIRLTADTFQLAYTWEQANAHTAINLLDSGTGIFETEVKWTWRLESGQRRAQL